MKQLRLYFEYIFLIFLFIFSAVFQPAYSNDNYDKLYETAEPFQGALYNDIDPWEDEESLIYAYNPYPLFRTSAYLYFKDIKIDPGYYTITPRKLKGAYYVLFKQGGKVKFIIPAAKKEMTPLNFYKANIPQRKKTKFQKIAEAVSNKFYKMSIKSQKIPPPQSFVQSDQEQGYTAVMVYYGEDKYTLLFKRTPY